MSIGTRGNLTVALLHHRLLGPGRFEGAAPIQPTGVSHVHAAFRAGVVPVAGQCSPNGAHTGGTGRRESSTGAYKAAAVAGSASLPYGAGGVAIIVRGDNGPAHRPAIGEVVAGGPAEARRAGWMSSDPAPTADTVGTLVDLVI